MRTHASGFSIIELMVGIALALLIAAAAVLLLGSSVGESRRLLLEARLTQDLRSSAELIVRQTRRAGHWGAASTLGVWTANASALPNPYAALVSDNSTLDTITLRYSQDTVENNTVDTTEQVGFRLRSGTIEVQLGASTWQALTDSSTLVVTGLRIQPSVQLIALESACACVASGTCAAPQVQVRSVDVELSGRAVGDASVLRTVRSTARLRNDNVIGGCNA